jgi:predicted  nucleic acid-binding Zn-ribbon protein
MGLENFPKNTSEQPIEYSEREGRSDFLTVAENLNPEIGTLEQQLSQLTQRIASIKEQMRGGRYAGKLTDLPNAETERELLKKQIETHPDFGSRRQGFERNFTGRDDRINKWG